MTRNNGNGGNNDDLPTPLEMIVEACRMAGFDPDKLTPEQQRSIYDLAALLRDVASFHREIHALGAEPSLGGSTLMNLLERAEIADSIRARRRQLVQAVIDTTGFKPPKELDDTLFQLEERERNLINRSLRQATSTLAGEALTKDGVTPRTSTFRALLPVPGKPS